MSLVIESAVSRVRPTLDTRLTGGLCATYGPQGSRYYGAMSVLCTSHAGDDELDLASQIADEIKDAHITAPEYLDVRKIIEQDLIGANQSARVHLRHRPLMSISVLSINQRKWTLGHVGINRAWLFRDTRLQQLTSDHATPSISGPPLLNRGIGMANDVDPDILEGNLEHGDVLVMTTPNIHNKLDGATLMSCLIGDWPAKKMAAEITKKAMAAGVTDEMAATVIRIGRLPAAEVSITPVSQMPRPGRLPELDETIDRFLIEKRLRKGRLSNFYKARDTLNDAEVILKFPAPEFMSGPDMESSFIRDEWLSKRQDNQIFLTSYPLARGRRSALYSAYEYRKGENLSRRLQRKQHLSFAEVLLISNQLLRALETLHAEHQAHRDIRPENLILDKRNQQIFLLGIDQNRVDAWLKRGRNQALTVLNPHFLPPEIFSSNDWGGQSDIYSVGVCLFQLATGTYPYGQIKTPEEVVSRKLKHANRYNPEIPDSFADALAIAVSINVAERFQTIKQFAAALSEVKPAKGRSSFLRRGKTRQRK